MTGKRLTEIYEQLQESSKRKENSLLTIDDFQAQLKKKILLKFFKKIYKNETLISHSIFITAEFLSTSKTTTKVGK